MGKVTTPKIVEQILSVCLSEQEAVDSVEQYLDERKTTKLKKTYGGFAIMWTECENCGQSVQYPTDHPYNYCPYCKARVIYDGE